MTARRAPFMPHLVVWNHHTRRLKGGEWNQDSGTAHAVDGGRTVCGVDVGTPSNGWEWNQHARGADAAFVDCRRCRRVLEAVAR